MLTYNIYIMMFVAFDYSFRIFENEKKPVIKIKTSGGKWVGILNVFVKNAESVKEMIN